MSSIIFFIVLGVVFYACLDYRKSMKKEEKKSNERNKTKKEDKT